MTDTLKIEKVLPTFEEVWNTAETVSKKNNAKHQAIIIALHNYLDDYLKTENIPAPEIKKILKQKKFGELLFKVAELSRLDDINIYAALQLELQYLSSEANGSPSR